MNDYERINKLKRELQKFIPTDRPTYEDLALKDEDGKTLFEYIVDNDINKVKIIKLFEDITNNYDYLFYMITHNYFPDKYSNYELLLDSSRGTPIIQLIFEKQYYEFSKLPVRLIKELFVKKDGKYLIEDFIKMDESHSTSIIEKIDDPILLFTCLKDINRLDLLKYAKKCMLYKFSNGKTLMESLNESNISLAYVDNDSYECAEELFRIGNYNAMLNLEPRILINYPSRDNNYLNMLIEKYKNGEDIRFENMIYSSIDSYNLAILFITLARNNVPMKKPYDFNLVPSVTSDHKPTIIHMLEMDKELTIKLFIDEEVMSKIRKYLSDLLKDRDEEIYNSDLDHLISLFPNEKKLLEEIQNGKTKVKESDYYTDDYLKPFGGEKTFLEYAFKNKIRVNNIYTPDSVEAVLLYIKYNKNLMGGIKEKLLYEKVDDNKLLIDVLIENKYENVIRDSASKDLRVLDYCEKYNNYSILSHSILEELFVYLNGSCEAEKYLNNEKFIDCLQGFAINKNLAFKLRDKGYISALKHAKEYILLSKTNGKTILESLLENNIEPTFYGYDFENIETIKLLYRYKKPDLMWNGVTSLLVNNPTQDNNYLQYMINSYKQGIDVHFEKKNFLFRASYEDIAKCYIQMAKAGLVELLDDLDEEGLLEIKGGEKDNLLAHLIRLDRDTTVNKILGVKMMKRPKINAQLKVLSRDGLIDIPFPKYDADEICRRKLNEMYTEGLVSPCEDLLTELRELFVNDSDSDITLVDALITSYRYVTAINPIFIEELKVLINIKKNNPMFHYKKIDSGAYFDGESVCCDDTTIGTLIHETGHAIHHYTTNEAIPNGFFELIDKIKNSPGWIHKVVEYSNKFHSIREKIHKQASSIVTKVMASSLTDEDEEEIDKLLNEEKEKIKKLYLNKGYTEEELDAILSSTFTKKEFLSQKATIEVGEVEDFLMRHLYDAFTAIGDFIDGITYGHFRSKVLKDEEGKVIPSGYGHGVRYYRTRYLIFCEMVANYSEIIKSKHSKEIIALLRHIVGDELVDMLDNFYQTEMIRLPEYEMNEEESVAVGRRR